jgi:ABC-type transport system involved in multi-copper enzyme maturation permease subunit
VISTYLDNSKTALIVAFTVWVFAVLITPRIGFIVAKIISPTRTSQSVYMEKTAMRDDFNAELEKQKTKFFMEVPPDKDGVRRIGPETTTKIDERMSPLEEEYRLKFQNRANELDRDYKRETQRQEQVGETLSRITPTSSLIYLATSLTQTGKEKRNRYSQAGDRYYDALHTDVFSKIVDHVSARIIRPEDTVTVTQPPHVEIATLDETFRQSVVDVLLLCFFAVVLTTVAFLKFFRSDI